MFAVDEAAADAIRRAYQNSGESSAAMNPGPGWESVVDGLSNGLENYKAELARRLNSGP